MSQDRPRTFTNGERLVLRQAAQHICDAWNGAHTPGLPVIVWPHGFSAAARIATTRSYASVTPHAIGGQTLWTPGVYVNGHGQQVPLVQVAEISADNMRGRLKLDVEVTVEVDLEAGVLQLGGDLGIACERALRPLKLAIAGAYDAPQNESTDAGDVAGDIEP